MKTSRTRFLHPSLNLMIIVRTVGTSTTFLLFLVLFSWIDLVQGTSAPHTTSTAAVPPPPLPRTTTAEVSALGDPHFQTWSGHKYDFHGSQCDLVLLHSTKFAAGRGIDIHIRTSSSGLATSQEQQQQQGDANADDVEMFSYISGVALRIGQDVLEVASHGTYYLNGVLKRVTKNNDEESLAGFPIVHRLLENDRYFHDVIVESGENDAVSDPVFIRLTSYQDICGVRILFGDDKSGKNKSRDYYFSDAVGMLGRYESVTALLSVGGEEMVTRNGKTVLTDNPNAYGLEWQVRSSASIGDKDPQLFQSNDSFQQYPNTCILPPPPPSTNTSVSAAERVDDARRQVRRGRRRDAATTSNHSTLQEAAAQRQQKQQQAEKACADKGMYREECMFDVLKTGDITMAHAY